MYTVFPTNKQNHPRAIHPNEMRRGGACVPARTSAQRRFHTKNTHIVCGEFNDGCALAGRRGRAHRHRPYQTPPNHAGAITASHCTFDSPRQPRGVPLPHRGYTLDSAGLASATQPTLGNGFRQVVLPTTWVVLFLIAHHYHTRQMDYSRMISTHEN